MPDPQPLPLEAPVVVVGGGPVGLTTALELAHHGIASLLVEPREAVEHSRPRAKTTSTRTMELFRRTGAAAEIRRRAQLPIDWSQDIRFCTTPGGMEITRFTKVLGLDLENSQLTSEAAQQIAQPVVEEALRALADRHPLVTARFGARATAVDLSADPAGGRPRVTIEDADGTVSVVIADYVIGADGSRSVVRDALGARYEGAAGGRPNVNVTFRSRELAGLVPPALHHWVLNPEAPGVVGPLDLEGTWWAIATGVESVADDAEAAAVVRRLVDADIDVEVLATDPWQARLLLADSYGSGRAYLVGDAAHQNPPWGGHGFNTGVGDAVNLAWKLAAVLNGWAPEQLLASYEAERKPIEQQTIDLAANNMRSLSIDLASPWLMVEGPDGDAARAAAAETIRATKADEFYANGLVLGYGYGPDAAAQAPSTREYVPIAAPGNRLPHSRNAAGESLFDLLGPEFTLLSAGAGAGAARGGAEKWLAAAAERGVPLVAVDPAAHGFPPVAGEAAVLVRPDQHIAWLGEPGSDAGAILERVTARGLVEGRDPPAPESGTATSASATG